MIGIVGGIGSGKSFVANLFGELGCFVSKSDDHVHAAYARSEVVEQVRKWWGDEVLLPGGKVNRAAIAERVFGDRDALKRLESLIHPLVGRAIWRDRADDDRATRSHLRLLRRG